MSREGPEGREPKSRGRSREVRRGGRKEVRRKGGRDRDCLRRARASRKAEQG